MRYRACKPVAFPRVGAAPWWCPGLVLVACAASLSGCARLLPEQGGGLTTFEPPREIEAADVALPSGYAIEAIATGLTFPSGMAVDDDGRVYVIEAGYSYGEVWMTPRLLRIEPDGEPTVIATGEHAPWNGVQFHDGSFYVAAGGAEGGGQILRIGIDGGVAVVVDGLPSLGDHHTNGPAAGPDGWLYFGQGTATNSGVVGADNAEFGWLYRHPEFHDTPCEDIRVRARNFETSNPLTDDPDDRVSTGPYSPFGTRVSEGQTIPGAVPCNGAIMRVRPSGGAPELVAWGLRNPFGLAWSPDGRLYTTENQYDQRGSRPVWGAGDLLWEVVPGTWYGWPDYHADRPLTDADWYQPPDGEAPDFVLAEHLGTPPRPAAVLAVHSSSNGFDFSRDSAFGHVGEAFIAQFGDMVPGVGESLAPVGFKVVRVDVETGIIHDFAVNRGDENGPASLLGTGGLERPVAARFSNDGRLLYVVDFGVMTMSDQGPEPHPGTGVLWRITPDERAER